MIPKNKSKNQVKTDTKNKKSVRPHMKEVVAQAIRDFNLLSRYILDKAFAQAMQLIQYKRTLGKGKYKQEYYEILLEIGWTAQKANAYIKMYETFGRIPRERLCAVRLETLLELTKKKYTAIVERMHDTEELLDATVREWMKEFKPTPKPKVNGEPTSGWERMPSGGARVWVLRMYDEDRTPMDIEELAKCENLLPHQIVKKAIAHYIQDVRSLLTLPPIRKPTIPPLVLSQ